MNNNDTLRDQFEYLRNNDVKGPYHEPVSIAKDEVVVSIPDVYESGLKFCCTNYEFSNVNYLSDFGGGYGCDVRQPSTKNLSASFKCNFNGQEIDECDDDSLGITGSLYDRLNPLFQELLWSLESPANSDIVEGVENYMK